MSAMDLAMMDPTKTPSGPPPPGVIPNFVNPVSNAHVSVIVTSIMLPLMLIFVSLRVYANLWISHRFAPSDYACILAAAASISFASVLYFTVSQHTIGKHIWDIPISLNSVSSIQNYSVMSILMGPTLFLAKLSVLLLYLELFKVNKQARIAIAIGLTIIAAQCIATIVGYSVLCVPKPGDSWMLKAATHGCVKTATAFGVAMGSLSVFSDIYILWIPLPIIWQLHMPTRKKVGVSVIFITGLFALLASTIAIVYRVRQFTGGDNPWNAGYSYMLVVVEVNVSIMCSCMPSYATCLRHHLPTLRSFQYRIRSRFYSSNKPENSTAKFGQFERADSDNSGENMKLTLGSAIRGGEFLQTQHAQRKEWPLETVDENEKRTPQMTGRGVREEYRESSIV